jgi:hypothetical protein
MHQPAKNNGELHNFANVTVTARELASVLWVE